MADLSGRRFGRLFVVRQTDQFYRSHRIYECKCDCGKTTFVKSCSLVTGNTQSCGCLNRERTSEASRKDITGKRFGRLVAIKPVGSRAGSGIMWRCKCDCGKEIVTSCAHLISGHTSSCGCYRSDQTHDALAIDLTGKRFGRLVAIEPVRKDAKDGILWKCKCDCGNFIEAPAGSLSAGYRKSCGCYVSEVQTKWKTPIEKKLYKVYHGMRQRCYNPNYDGFKYWGGRGIRVCDEWLNDGRKFVDWAIEHGYKRGLSIDRIDNDGPYAPWNCRFTDDFGQANNRRNNRRIEALTGSYTATQCARLSGRSLDGLNKVPSETLAREADLAVLSQAIMKGLSKKGSTNETTV